MSKTRRIDFRAVYAAGAFAAALAVIAFTLYWQSALNALRDADRARKLKTLYVALVYYSSEHGGLPPAGATDGASGLRISWRVLLLPYLDSKSLYANVNLNEPWDSTGNLPLLEAMPEYYRSPLVVNKHSTHANYFAITGSHAPWWNGNCKKPPTSSGSDEILLIELPASTTPWMKPWDPALEDLLDVLRPNAEPLTACSDTAELMYITVHGEVKTIPIKTDRETLKNLILGCDQGSGR